MARKYAPPPEDVPGATMTAAEIRARIKEVRGTYVKFDEEGTREFTILSRLPLETRHNSEFDRDEAVIRVEEDGEEKTWTPGLTHILTERFLDFIEAKKYHVKVTRTGMGQRDTRWKVEAA